MKYLPLNPEIFVQNRKRFTAKMVAGSIAIFNSNDELPSNGDALFKFKQNSDLYWLTGIEQEDSMLILFPDNPDKKCREVLILVRPNELKEKWDGHRLRAKEAEAISGIKTIIWLDSIDALLQVWIQCNLVKRYRLQVIFVQPSYGCWKILHIPDWATAVDF